MIEKRFQVFIDCVTRYFSQFNEEDIIIDTPYLQENHRPVLLDYTGMIGITGAYKGIVYFTASTALLQQILLAMKEIDQHEDNLVDLVGEVANTIAGNARTEFGDKFSISIPLVFKGKPDNIVLPKDQHSFTIPISWKNNKADIVIYLQH